MDKRCPRCQETLPVSEFYPSSTIKDGLSRYCVSCARKAEAESYLKRKLRAVEHLGGECCKCGYGADHRALAIDHVNGGGTNARRSGMQGRRLLNAVSDGTAGAVQLLCWNCNTIKRVEDGEHGGSRVYVRDPPSADLPNKRCPKCATLKPASDFVRNKGRRDGLSVYCRPCHMRVGQDAYRALRLRAVLHCGGACLHCGYDADDRALVFDHVEGGGGAHRLSGTVHRRALNAVLNDVRGQYQLLCANCNQIKSFETQERIGKRLYDRTVPTMRVDRPDLRGSDEIRALRSAQACRNWQDPEYRARQSELRSAAMKARWASGEIPNRPKSA